MKTRAFLLIAALLALAPALLPAQRITHGPIFGAVGPDSVRVYLRTRTASTVVCQYSTSADFAGAQSVTSATVASRDSSIVFSIHGLQANTKYYTRFTVGGVPDTTPGSFTTFPQPGERGAWVLATGSCQESPNMDVFDVIPLHHPHVFVHLGDWTYPSYQLPNTYPVQDAMVDLAWRRRYAEVKMDIMLRHLPVDYVHDDDDFVEGGSKRYSYDKLNRSTNAQNQPVVQIEDVQYSPALRQKLVRAYTRYFPHYPLADTSEGIFHSFKLGNAEVFFIDARTTADPSSKALTYNAATNRWSLVPHPQMTMLRQKQMEWLKNGLKNSTADWKVIASGAVFNQKLRQWIAKGMDVQEIQAGGRTGFDLAYAFLNDWPGYPDQDTLMNFIRAEGIRDVMVISGQSHVNMVDDGTNSGLPEINASGLSVKLDDKVLWQELNTLGQAFGMGKVVDSLWNGGGDGITTGTDKNGFGKITFYAQDSARLEVINEDNVVTGGVTLLHSSKVSQAAQPLAPGQLVQLLYPNPAKEAILLRLAPDYTPASTDATLLTDMEGRTLARYPLAQAAGRELSIPVGQLAPGCYQLMLHTRHGIYGHRFVRQ